jgi:hypothetical protein
VPRSCTLGGPSTHSDCNDSQQQHSRQLNTRAHQQSAAVEGEDLLSYEGVARVLAGEAHSVEGAGRGPGCWLEMTASRSAIRRFARSMARFHPRSNAAFSLRGQLVERPATVAA